MILLEADRLVKDFMVTKKEEGLKGSVYSLFHPVKTRVRVVDGISFDVQEGEIVAFIGPNGAGKSTTVKMMTGILHPTSGTVRISGISPHQSRKSVVGRIGVVFGQRSQLYWDLRRGQSFE